MQTAPPSTDKPPAPPAEDRKARIARYVALFVMPFLMVTMMFATYVGTMHSPQPHHLPIAVVGVGPAAEATADGLAAAAGEAVDVRVVATTGEVENLLRSQDIAGALEVPATDAGVATIWTASAAGASQATTVQQMLAPVVPGSGWSTDLHDVAPLPEGDTSGTAALFGAMGMMLAGYVPLSLLMMSLPHLLTLRRFLPLAAAWGAGVGTLIWLILGPIVGAVDGHFVTFLGVGTLAVVSVGLTQLLFTKLMGPLAVLLGMLLYVVFGMPASNLALSIHVMPGFFRFLHGVLPLPAAGEALRSFLYFDGVGAGRHLWVLVIWAVAAAVLCAVKERLSGTAIPTAPDDSDPDVPLPALAGGPLRSKRFRMVVVAAFPLSIVVMVVGVMGFSLHRPEVHDLPVAVVAASPAQAEQTVDAMAPAMAGVLDLQPVSSMDEAIQLVQTQQIVAIYELPMAADAPATLYTSAGAGVSQQSAVQAIFSRIAAQQGTSVELTDLTPLTPNDTMGSNSLYVGMSWVMAGFLMLAVLRGGAPELTRFRQFLPLLAGWAIGMSVWLWLLIDVIIGAVSINAFAMIGLGALTIFSMSAVTAVFTRTLGLAAIVPVMVILMLAGVPASGGGLSIYMVPEFFRPLQNILPLPAAVDFARSLVYFDGEGVWANALVIAVWGAIGLALNRVIDRVPGRRSVAAQHVAGSDEPALPAVAVGAPRDGGTHPAEGVRSDPS